jgi:arylamine N-acetyltransferase
MPAAEVDVDAYLTRIGLDPARHREPTVANLFAIHRAQVEAVAYTSLDFHLGQVHGIDGATTAARIAAGGRGGYCFHLNGALAAVLDALGYAVRRHVGGVQMRRQPTPPGPTGDHLVLTVENLPAPQAPDGVWFVDAGLGDALYEPLPLVPGEYAQGPFRYRLRPSDVAPGGWRFEHDPACSFAGMDFSPAEVGLEAFAGNHADLSGSPDSVFVQLVIVQRRDATGVDSLRGCVLTRIGSGASEREITDPADWYAVLAATFGLRLDDVDPAARAALWRRVRLAHAAWQLQRAASSVYGPLSHQDVRA